MPSLYLIIPVVLLFTLVALGIFYWAVNNKQYEDVERHGSDILFDEPSFKSTVSGVAGEAKPQALSDAP